MDLEDIGPGDRIGPAIDGTMARCDAVLAVIGPRWSEILARRAESSDVDYVRRELEAALARNVKIVPVLVGGATPSQLKGLPESLAGLAQHEAMEIRDATFGEDCARLARSLRLRRRRRIWPWAAAAFAAAALAAVIWVAGAGGRTAKDPPEVATARMQLQRGDYEGAFRTLQGTAAQELQADAAMGWARTFRAPEGTNAAALLDDIKPPLDAALARSGGKGPRAADLLAHLGWWHWLNEKIAHREFERAALKDLREALRVDASNVYAHGMLGNLLMQTGGKTAEALAHFRQAVETKKERPFVRQLQLGALIYPRDAQSRAALIGVANEMRREGEPLEDRQKGRILSSYSPTVNSYEELMQTLGAVAPADASATYQWLAGDSPDRAMEREFVRASLLKLEGKRDEARAAFEALRAELKRRGYDGRIVQHVQRAIQETGG